MCACSATNRKKDAAARNIAPIANRKRAYACARTACITVLIAVRLAKCTLRIIVNAEHRRTELKLGRDERLLAGVRSAVEHVANRHGLTVEERADLGVAAEQACRAALVHLDETDSLCSVIIDDYEDRVEVSVESPRHPKSAKINSSLGSLAAVPIEEREAEMKKRVDRVDRDTSNGRERVILVKYFHKNPTHS